MTQFAEVRASNDLMSAIIALELADLQVSRMLFP
jgi:hypothetical protein